MQSKLKIGFIGGGNMASALIGGMNVSMAGQVSLHVVDINQQSLNRLETEWQLSTALQVDDRLADLDVIVLAVKPQQFRDALESIKPYLRQQLLISIAAGIRATDMQRWLAGYANIVRTMPNTPALINQGMTGLFALPAVTQQGRDIAEKIMEAVGQTLWLDEEHLLDAVTAVSGSGPAYVFYFIEAMQAAARGLGLSDEAARRLALATFQGASSLALHASDDVSVLRERVTSKGGTTYAALTQLQNHQVHAAIVDAIHAAAERGRQLGEEFGQQ